MDRLFQRRGVLSAAVAVGMISASVWWFTAGSRPEVPVIVYLVDTMRADRLGVYGHSEWNSPSPNLDQLGSVSVVFDAAYAPAPWTLPSVASLITSRWPCEHDLLTSVRRLTPKMLTLAERLQDVGYSTAGMYSNHLVGPMADLNRGFDTFVMPLGEYQFPEFTQYTVANRGDSPLFLYLHTMEPHNFYITPQEYAQTFGFFTKQDYAELKRLWLGCRALTVPDYYAGRPVGTTDNTEEQQACHGSLLEILPMIDRMYEASIYHADVKVGEVIEELKRDGIWDEAIFIFLSDHGDEFYEHGQWSHEQAVYEEQVRVPLIIHYPGDRYAGLRISEPVSLVDIMPTIFDFLGVPELCDDCRGRSLSALLERDAVIHDSSARVMSFRHNYRTYYKPAEEARGDVNVVIRQDEWKGIWNDEISKLELYDLASDPGERQDVGDQNKDIASTLAKDARQWLGECRARAPEVKIVTMDPQRREQLRAMGYLP
jgi:arylsulfatase A-like enzyme